jgi:hypothetical protein
MRLACLMPVGPGEADRHLERCLKSAREWADLVLVYGDNPDAATVDLIARYAHHSIIGTTNLYEQGEHVVRNQLWALADKYLDADDIACCLDADEEFAESPTRAIQVLQDLDGSPYRAFSCRFFHLWAPDGTQHRIDGLWRSPVGPRICKFEPNTRLRPLYETAWVCPPLPPHLLNNAQPGPVLNILHWSYANEKDRAPKHERYTEKLGHDLAHVNSIIEPATLEAVPCFS